MTPVEIMRRYRLSAERLASVLNCDIDTVRSWANGHAPPYFEPMCLAISRSYPPAPADKIDIERLGISVERVAYWNFSGIVPLSVRYAMAGIDYQKPSAHEIKVLRQIDIGRYYRVTGGYRSHRPLLPLIRLKTANALISRGLVFRDVYGVLRLTRTGKRLAYDNS